MSIKQFNPEKFKCRCSSIEFLLATPQESKPIGKTDLAKLDKLEKKALLTETELLELQALKYRRDNPPKFTPSDTAITYLTEWYAWEMFKKAPINKESMELIPTEKGKKVEEDSIFLLSQFDQKYYQKNTEIVENEYLKGEPDVFEGENIMAADTIIDMKNSLDYVIFLKQIASKLEKKYINQVRGYGDITGAKNLIIARMIMNMPSEMVEDYKRKIAHKMGVIDPNTASFAKTWQVWENSMNYDDIPINLRIHKTKVEPFTEQERQLLYDRVKYCRDWLAGFHETYLQINS